ncbi:MAG TPA: TIGR03032 family protein [Thermoanaerobaculia bacterium]|nr:TIGR03032 family protein [Thermoanaerobaculia bacterium]
MRLPTEFIRLPLTFDAGRLAVEAGQFDESDWRPHPHGYPGNSALSLVAIDGDPANDSVKGAMRATPHLDRCPYIRQVLASLGVTIGRTRLMRIDGNAEATPHADSNYYWLQRMRVHVPVVTDPAVTFLSGGKSVHMAAGEAWIFDTWKIHNVLNPNPTRRIHLVCDTTGSPTLLHGEARFVAFDSEAEPQLTFESRTMPVVMSPDEQTTLVRLLQLDDRGLAAETDRFLDEWRAVWHAHGERRSGWPQYRALLDRFDAALAKFEGLRLDNGLAAPELVRAALVRPALNPELAERAPEPVRRRRIDRPVFVVSSPRAGSTLLFETLAQSPTVFSPGRESHSIIEGIDALHPASREWESNRLTAADATPMIASVLETRFLAELRSRDGSQRFPPRVRMLEKTPKNSLRIPFLQAIWPDAFFIYLYRDPRATISSMLEAWRSGKFVTYPNLPGWQGPPWSLVLTPGWREVNGKPLAEIVADQWKTATRFVLDDLEALPPDSWSVASYDALVAEPQKEIERLSAFVDIAWDRVLTAPLPLSRTTLTKPEPDKWMRNGEEIDSIAGSIEEVAERARELFARPPAMRARIAGAPPRDRKAAAEPPHSKPFRSVHTNTLPEVLKAIGGSLLVSTYQSGRVVLVRRDGNVANTHFVGFESPMGMALSGDRLALSTADSVWDYRKSDAVKERLEPKGRHDACYIPRNAHLTGDIRVHEVAFDAQGTLWLVNTRFSALCTLDADHSFVPRWQPPFITELRPEDRCHLNGLAIIDGRPRLVTCLGETNTPAGWRANKAAGGALIDIDSGMTVVRGLSMPHSPRWYAGKLWLLESGKGSLIYVDTQAGRVETVAQLPGFTRGLAFSGHYAFIGLSQVRESVFDGIPLARRLKLEDRACGVWVVDIRSGNIAAFLKFEDAVQEIFDVQVLAGMEFPELLEARSELVRSHFEVPGTKPAQSLR